MSGQQSCMLSHHNLLKEIGTHVPSRDKVCRPRQPNLAMVTMMITYHLKSHQRKRYKRNVHNTQSAAVAHVPSTMHPCILIGRATYIHTSETYQCQAYLTDTYSYHSAPQVRSCILHYYRCIHNQSLSSTPVVTPDQSLLPRQPLILATCVISVVNECI